MLKRSQAKRLRFLVAITAGITLSFLSSGQVNDRSTLRGGKSGALQTAKTWIRRIPRAEFHSTGRLTGFASNSGILSLSSLLVK